MSHPIRRGMSLAVAALVCSAMVACSHSSTSAGDQPQSGSTATGTCPDALSKAQEAVKEASQKSTPWNGPTSGPKAVSGKSIIYVAQDMTNPGVAGAAKGVQAAAKAIGWQARVIDGQGSPAGIQSAFSSALASKPDGIVIGGFDPASTSSQAAQAESQGIPLVGWQAEAEPGPHKDPKLFSNVTTRVQDVAKISADYIIAQSNGTAGVIVFTDKSIPFADKKSDMIVDQLKTCDSINILSTQNVPLADVSNRMPDQVSSLWSQYQDKWNYSVAINDVYFETAAPALRAAGVSPTQITNIGAGDGDPSALQRVRTGQYEAASVPSPLHSEGWQIIDEFNRAFNKQDPSGYVPIVHLSTKDNLGESNSWDPDGYQDAYKKIWGK